MSNPSKNTSESKTSTEITPKQAKLAGYMLASEDALSAFTSGKRDFQRDLTQAVKEDPACSKRMGRAIQAAMKGGVEESDLEAATEAMVAALAARGGR